MLMTVITAATSDQDELVEIQRQSCLLSGIEKERHIALHIDRNYSRHPSWFKVRGLIEHLPHHEYLLWMDADSMMVQPTALWHGHLDNSHPAFLAKDANGWNCGIMAWRRCPEAFEWLWKIYDSFDKFRDHPWFEQAAFHTMAEAIKPKELPKVIFNAYVNDRNSDSAILHWPSMPFSARLAAMTKELELLKARK